ncbi:MAG: PQQ-binding-like beta-propeller repeat protein [Planctomycetes bacterium]|nr:PQQ-binding-like beta-propeller repeat protein [Planctomycetota bacterium]
MKNTTLSFSVTVLVLLCTVSLQASDQIVVAGSSNHYVYAYDADGNDLWSYDTGAEVASVAISYDGLYIAVGSLGNKLYLFEADGNLLWDKDIPISSGYGGGWMGRESKTVAISSDGEYVIAGCSDKLYVYRNINDGELVWSHAGRETCVGISPDGNYIVSTGAGDVHLFSIASSSPLWTKGIGAYWVATSTPGYVAVSTGSSVLLYDPRGTAIWGYKHTKWSGDYIHVYMTGDGRGLVGCNDDPSDSTGSALCYFNDEKDGTPGWSSADGTPVWSFVPFPSIGGSDLYCAAISDDGETIATGGSPSNNGSFVLSSAGSSPLQTFSFGNPQSFDLTCDGQFGVCGDRTGHLYFFSKESSSPLWTKTVGGYVQTVAISPLHFVRILSPNGDENLWAGENFPVEWQATESITDILIEYSIDNGQSWQEVDPPNIDNTGSYDWVVPKAQSDQCLIRISDAYDSNTVDTSDSVFTIKTLDILSPDGSEQILSGTNYYIDWQDTYGIISNIVIEYSINNGQSWQEVDPPNIDNTGSYDWIVPKTQSDQCLVRVFDSDDPNISDMSNDLFSIKRLIVVFPNDGERFLADTNEFIAWESVEDINEVLLEYSTDNGQSWIEVDPRNIGNFGWYEWLLPLVHSYNSLVRVTDANDPNISDTSDLSFMILSCPVTVLSPNGDETLLFNSDWNIQFAAIDSIDEVVIEYSTDNGLIWERVDPCTIENTGSYDWLVPDIVSDEAIIRISDASDSNTVDTSNGTFYIMSGTVSLFSPRGGEFLLSGDTHTVRWSTINSITDIIVEYSWDGISWTEVNPPNIGNTGRYDWIVPETNWDGWIMRVLAVNYADASDTSDNVFTIYECQIDVDIDGDCYVGWLDLSMLADKWLTGGCVAPNWCSGSDLDQSGDVNMIDYALLGDQWLNCGNPFEDDCSCSVPWPACWDWLSQCYGDTNNDNMLTQTDIDNVQAILMTDPMYYLVPYGDPDYDACVDFDRNLWVSLVDLNILLQSIMASGGFAPTDCECGAPYPWPPPPEVFP